MQSQRNPILHITRADLSVILNRVLPPELSVTHILDEVYNAANNRRMQLRGMYRFRAKADVKKKGDRMLEAMNEYVGIFNRLLAGERTKLRPSGVEKPIPKSDSSYLLLTEITTIALDFHEKTATKNVEQSFLFFIQSGLELMKGKYGLGKFKYYRERIWDNWILKKIISEDTSSEQSQRFYTIWRRIVKSYAPAYIDVESEQDYADVILARQEADSMKATYEDWITAQFEEMAFLESIPNFNQLYGLNAKKRYQKYISNKSYKKRGEVAEEVADFETDEQRAYFEALRNSRSVN